MNNAMVADESKESLLWLFQTWLRAMPGHPPRSIVADQDLPIKQALSQVFPGAHHRYSAWQIREKDRENLRPFPSEFKEVHEHRENWVPAYLRASFLAGIPISGAIEPFFGASLDALTPLGEFIPGMNKDLSKDAKRKEKRISTLTTCSRFISADEEGSRGRACRRLYTLNVFRIFQNELVQSYNYLCLKTHGEGAVSRFLVRKESEKHAVTFSASNRSSSCSCQMFEHEGVLCRHILKVFNLLDVRELPSRYILHRWTKNTEFGFVRDVESGVSSRDLKALMVWSLREAASKYIEFGTSSLEKYTLAYEIMREGGKKLCCQR
ncbi:hypothetical protein IGI04_041201 [Brassica rapa subsp. trilocularis]|uniref:SWIM-type domain-containing protein n=1 Tax=Brassica rapa subsp. trilocularis TaxID=1813537 RepID=A0ABQ7KQ34_BRACM|nr:hypothetical protein IGI04_041201 [Brassica rapa subsp. trilocularis]